MPFGGIEEYWAYLLVLSLIPLPIAWVLKRRRRARGERPKDILNKAERIAVIGCTSGIGREVALQYAKRGAKLILFSRRKDVLEEVRTECIDIYGGGGLKAYASDRVLVVAGDATNEADVVRCAQVAENEFGGLDTLILNAGALSVLPFTDLCGLKINERYDLPSGWKAETNGDSSLEVMQTARKLTEINYLAPIDFCYRFLPMLITTSVSPNIMVVSSMAGLTGTPSRTLYAGSKHALQGFFDSLRLELKRYNVHIGIISPATVDTDLRKSALDRSSASSNDTPVAGSKGGKLTPVACAERIIAASDAREKNVIIPFRYSLVPLLKAVWPSKVDELALRKYGM
ncbi:hypothetical protein BZG36_00664 [Bifiguratus adelaidae]|uniref:NAD(P)-binding protein n=1 Tax=Bifiguratus adelaidae TaxID=1938954 RepID=A0A261Y726_9FUNG|nr:hypothetical protein BZG36_00664 [Bifiguratus adelaidae]